METRFKLSEEDYRYLFENASDAIWVHDMEGKLVDANKAFEKLSGYTLDEWAGMNCTQFLCDESLALNREVQRKLLNGEELEQPYEQRFVGKDGATRMMKIATSLAIVNGEVKGFQHIARDVTEESYLHENMRFYIQQAIRAQEEERKRLARDLHDDVIPFLLLLIQRLDAITSGTKPRLSSSLKSKLEGLYTQVTEALENLRRYAQDLRPGIIDDLGMVAALEWMAENLAKDYGIDAKVEVIGVERDLPDEVQLLLFRITQEALTNIRRHAEASRAWITLEFGDDKTVLTVKDNGKGFKLPQRIGDLAGIAKLGILGMYERGRLLGGTLEVKSELGKGTEVVTKVPLPG